MSEAQGMKTYNRIVADCRITGKIAADTRGQHLVGPKFAVERFVAEHYGEHKVTKAPKRKSKSRAPKVDKLAVTSEDLSTNQREALLRLKLEKEKIAKVATPVYSPTEHIPSASGFPF